jgi:hypothetical protein
MHSKIYRKSDDATPFIFNHEALTLKPVPQSFKYFFGMFDIRQIGLMSVAHSKLSNEIDLNEAKQFNEFEKNSKYSNRNHLKCIISLTLLHLMMFVTSSIECR